MNCSNCNAPLPSDAVFCSNCGTRVQATPPTAAANTAEGVRTVSNLGTMVPTELLDRPAALMLEPGTLFAERYLVESQIGAGGMGIVYVAKDRNTSEDIALKLLHPGLLSGPNAMKRLVAEGVTARQIRHPNIVAVYDIAIADGQPFLTMEYVKGSSLRSWLKNAMRSSQEVPVATAIGLVKAILAGLAEAHRMNVVHRDLKPENVLLLGDPFGGDYRVKILDFGIAKAVSGTGPVTTGSAGALGTPLYMAPEQRTAPDTVGPSADFYSVSVMLYELLMENPPQGLWEPPSKSRKDVSAALDAVIERGVKTRARDRFQSADDYVAALDAAQKQPAGSARPASGTAGSDATNALGDAWNSVMRLGKEITKSVADKAQAAQQSVRQSTQMSDAEWKEQWKKIQAEKAAQSASTQPAAEPAKLLDIPVAAPPVAESSAPVVPPLPPPPQPLAPVAPTRPVPTSENAKTLVTLSFGVLIGSNVLGLINVPLGIVAVIGATVFAFIAHIRVRGDLLEPNARSARNNALVGIGTAIVAVLAFISLLAQGRGRIDPEAALGFVVVFGAIAIWLLVAQVYGLIETVQGRPMPRNWFLLSSDGWPTKG